jgi:hypothetical protein
MALNIIQIKALVSDSFGGINQFDRDGNGKLRLESCAEDALKRFSWGKWILWMDQCISYTVSS